MSKLMFVLILNVKIMLLEIPDHIPKQISMDEKALVLEFAIFLYQQEVLSMRAAAGFAQISWIEFEQILAKRGIALHYSIHDLDIDRRKKGEKHCGRRRSHRHWSRRYIAEG